MADTWLRPVVVCGPSGVGKGTLINRLMAEYPGCFGFSVSHTTRAPRPGENNGEHYHFVSKGDVENMIAGGEFLEHANVHGNYYGTSLAAVETVLKGGKTCILDIDVQGAQAVKASKLNARFVFVRPPSMELLEQRLRGRGTETEEAVQKRLAGAAAEMAKAEEPGFFDSIIVNDSLDKAYREFVAFFPFAAIATPAERAAVQNTFSKFAKSEDGSVPFSDLAAVLSALQVADLGASISSVRLAIEGDVVNPEHFVEWYFKDQWQQKQAAIAIQKRQRGKKSKAEVEKKRKAKKKKEEAEQDQAASKIQGQMKNKKQKQQEKKEAKEKAEAASKIQARYKGKKERTDGSSETNKRKYRKCMDPQNVAQQYLMKHKIMPLMQHLCQQLCLEHPDKPRQFLVNALMDVKKKQLLGEPIFAFGEQDYETLYNMYNTCDTSGNYAQKALTTFQYNQAMEAIGISDPPDIPPELKGRVDLENFKKLAAEAVNNSFLF